MSFTKYRNPREFFDDDTISNSTQSSNSDEEHGQVFKSFITMDSSQMIKDMQELKEIVLTLATKITSLENSRNSAGSSSMITEDHNTANRIEFENEDVPQPAVGTETPNINFVEEERISKFLWNEVKALPEFDNWSITVESFISQIEESVMRIPRQYQSRFARLIRAHKIRSNEKRLLEGYVTTRIEELIQVLRTQFGEFKTLDVVQTERNFCLQKPSENILEYNKRFMTCQIAVERAISNTPNLTPEHKHYTLINERQTGLNLYLRGLHESLRIMVTANRPATLKEAQDLALNEERTAYAARLARQQAFGINRVPSFRSVQPRPIQPRFALPRPLTVTPARSQVPRLGNGPVYGTVTRSSQPFVTTPQPLKCYRCNGTNHYARNCPNFHGTPNTPRPPENTHHIKYIESTEQPEPNLSSGYTIDPSGFWRTPERESMSLKEDALTDIELSKEPESSQE